MPHRRGVASQQPERDVLLRRSLRVVLLELPDLVLYILLVSSADEFQVCNRATRWEAPPMGPAPPCQSRRCPGLRQPRSRRLCRSRAPRDAAPLSRGASAQRRWSGWPARSKAMRPGFSFRRLVQQAEDNGSQGNGVYHHHRAAHGWRDQSSSG